MSGRESYLVFGSPDLRESEIDEGSLDLAVIEDCAHAIETLVGGRHAGTFGNFGAFSFYVTKNVVTGEGGMVTTGSDDHAARIKRLALHGLSADAWKPFSDEGFRHYEVVEPGFKYNMIDLQAALGLHQLARVEDSLRRRQAIWACYDEAFAALPVLQACARDTGHAACQASVHPVARPPWTASPVTAANVHRPKQLADA